MIFSRSRNKLWTQDWNPGLYLLSCLLCDSYNCPSLWDTNDRNKRFYLICCLMFSVWKLPACTELFYLNDSLPFKKKLFKLPNFASCRCQHTLWIPKWDYDEGMIFQNPKIFLLLPYLTFAALSELKSLIMFV